MQILTIERLQLILIYIHISKGKIVKVIPAAQPSHLIFNLMVHGMHDLV